LRLQLAAILKAAGYEVVDFGAHELVTGDDCPKFCRALVLSRKTKRR